MLKSLDRLELCLAGLEKAFNTLECIPIVANFAGSARCALGKLQLISGIAIAIFASVAFQINHHPTWRHKCRLLAKHAIDHTLHGIANIIRGLAADKLFMGLAVFFSYDLMGLRWRYHGEEKAAQWPTTGAVI